MTASVRNCSRGDAFGREIVNTLEATFRRYTALDAGLPLVLALWTLATHLFQCFDAFPYLAITSPTKRCGKTRLAEIVELLAARGLRTVGASPAAIFRSIELDAPTLIIDEAEALTTKGERSEALREVLNAGYRDGQFVLRCESSANGSYQPKKFKTYCPKVLVLIGELPETLADRCIPMRMRRAGPEDKIQRFRYSRAKREVRRFQKEVSSWSASEQKRVKRYYRNCDLKFLKDREEELWLPLFSVCAVTAPERRKELATVAQQLAAVKISAETDEISITLLRDIGEIFARTHQERLPTSALVADLNDIEESPWKRWSRGKGLDPRWLARLLRPFRVHPRNLRMENDKIVKGYERVDFADVWATYLPAQPAATPLQSA